VRQLDLPTNIRLLARDKLSSLLQKSVNYGQKSFMTLAHGHLSKVFAG
jgi:hypothetical protein